MQSMEIGSMPPRFAAFLDLRGRRAVVVGAGEVAARKARSLARCGAAVTVIAPNAGESMAALAAQGEVRYQARPFEARDLEGADLAVAATNERAVNESVEKAARARGLLVNVADDPAHSSFLMAATVERLPVQVAVSTGGASPVLARRVAAMIEAALPASLAILAALAAEFRDAARRRLRQAAARRRFWERVCDGPVAAKALANDAAGARSLLERELDEAASREGEP
jgi:uroporphyrin-III C-methyltransferase/precorrin-2 dehydrogenase/sirohydrochlorin ferrochelatase